MSETDEVKKLQARAHGMLPGVAGICLFMLMMTMFNAFAALQGKFGNGGGKYGVLVLCTLLAGGVFGLLSLRRWGWALVPWWMSDALPGQSVCVSEDARRAVPGARAVCAGLFSLPGAAGSAGPAAMSWLVRHIGWWPPLLGAGIKVVRMEKDSTRWTWRCA